MCRPSLWECCNLSLLLEVILVDLVDLVGGGDADAHVVADHEVDQHGSVDEDHLGVQAALNKFAGAVHISTGRDKDALGHALA